MKHEIDMETKKKWSEYRKNNIEYVYLDEPKKTSVKRTKRRRASGGVNLLDALLLLFVVNWFNRD